MPIRTSDVKSFILQRLHQVGELKDLATMLGCAYETLRKDFRRQEGISLSEFIQSVRVARAKRLLVDTDKTCSEIAFEVRFSREEVAAHVFKREVGLTMGAYRRKYQRS